MAYTPFNQFVSRSPFLSYSDFKKMFSSKQKLLESWSEQKIRDAIYIASPVLFKELKKAVEENKNDKDDRLLLSFARYISRMATRCTPFGMFAGCTVGKVGDKTIIELDD